MDGRWSKLLSACVVATCLIAPGAFAEDSAKPAEAAPAPKKEDSAPAVDVKSDANLHVALNDVAIRKKWDDVVGKLDNMEKQWTAQGRRVIPVVDMKEEQKDLKGDKKKIETEREARKAAEEEDKQKQKAREEVEALKRDTAKKE
ncbi:MAG TPA: hypothetical protein VEJ63_23350 [Planctomycetota bacterium]|nr:hypothetical protein [Planctomycetota bacterium]